MNLSNKQRAIVDCNDKYISVSAGAGSGKTRVVVEKIQKCMTELQSNQKILAITFSNKASDELKQRLQQVFDERTIHDRIFIGTIHNFCNNILMTYGHLVGVSNQTMVLSNQEDEYNILETVVKQIPKLYSKYKEMTSKQARAQTVKILSDISIRKRSLVLPEEEKDNKLIGEIQTLLCNIMLNQNLMDFDDLILYTYKLFKLFPAILGIYQRMYCAIFVDEAQDINKAQYEIIKFMAGTNNSIMMVGDPKQAIYGFSGGSYYYFTNRFPNDFKVTKFQLDENYRSAQLIVEAANKLESNDKSTSMYPIKGDFFIKSCTNQAEEANFIASRIKSLMEEKNEFLDEIPNYSDFAIIARNRYVFTDLIKQLEQFSIPYSMKLSPRGCFSSESDFMKAFEALLFLNANPKDKIHLDKIAEIFKLEKVNSINELINNIENTHSYKTILSKLQSDLKRMSENINDDINLVPILNFLKESIDDISLTKANEEKQMVMNDINLWLDNWNLYLRNSELGNRKYTNFIRTIPLLSFTPPQNNTVTLSTVHMTKGLEYPIVFIMGLEDGTFPDYRAVEAYNFGSEKEMLEEKHSLFVAITRAKRLCYLSFSKSKLMPWGKEKNQEMSRLLTCFENKFFS